MPSRAESSVPSAVTARASLRVAINARMADRVVTGDASAARQGRAARLTESAGAVANSAIVMILTGRSLPSTKATARLPSPTSRDRTSASDASAGSATRRARRKPGGGASASSQEVLREPERLLTEKWDSQVCLDGGIALREGLEQAGSDSVEDYVAGGAGGIEARAVSRKTIESDEVAFAEDVPQLLACGAVLDQIDAALLHDPHYGACSCPWRKTYSFA